MLTTSNLLNLATKLSLNQSGDNQTTLLTLLDEQHRLLIEPYFDNERQFSFPTVGSMNLSLASEAAAGATSATLSQAWTYASGQQTCYFVSTVSSSNIITNAVIADGATSATLSTNWPYPTGSYSIQFPNSNLDIRSVTFTNGSSAITWSNALTGATTSTQLTYLGTPDSPKVTFTNGSATITWQEPLNSNMTSVEFSTGGFEAYRLPASISKITNATITVGTLRFVPKSIQTRTDWDNVNFLPYPSDIPVYYYIYGGYILFWPVPSTTGNMVTLNYKTKVQPFSTAWCFQAPSGGYQFSYVKDSTPTCYDYQTGTVAASLDGYTITGTNTYWATAQGTSGTPGMGLPTNTDLTQWNLGISIPPPYGDGLYYQIQQCTNDSTLILATPIQNAQNLSGATYSIGQMPLLQEDFHEMIAYGALMVYWNTIDQNPNKYKGAENEFNKRMLKLEDYLGTKQVNYNLGERPLLLNPNNYPYYPTNVQS